MKNLIIRPAAENDLISIWQYTFETWGVRQADRYIGDLSAAFKEVAAGRLIAKSASHVRAGYRQVKVGRHVVFLQDLSDRIEVVRVLHERVDARRGLSGDG